MRIASGRRLRPPSPYTTNTDGWKKVGDSYFGYTESGELHYQYDSPDALTVYGYDEAGRLEAVYRKTKGSDPVTLAQYDYDATGRLMKKTTPHATTAYAWAGRKIVGETTVSEAGTKSTSVLTVPGEDTALAVRNGDETHCTHCDHRGAPTSATDAKTHDRKALTLRRWLHGLLLLDRGYADHGLWASIEDRKGFFLTPLKSTTMPRLAAIRSGAGKTHLGKASSGDLRTWQTVDVDAEFTLRKGGHRTFRVLRVPVWVNSPDGGWEETPLWFVTNLPPEMFSAEQIATLYRHRWEVEQLFRTLKMVGRLDHLRSANPNVIHTFIYATLLGMVLAHNICALMRRCRPGTEPSPYRVATLLLMFLPAIISSLGTRRLPLVLKAFQSALWREGVNPNPGRPYRSTAYAQESLLAV